MGVVIGFACLSLIPLAFCVFAVLEAQMEKKP